ncbi:MAG: hypothetical protein HQL65_07305 [Magnetococcales bacterium]|nr:hypothetical protein [Magnetococcales bacterium]
MIRDANSMKNSERLILAACALPLILLLVIQSLPPENAYAIVQDFLDSFLPYYVLRARLPGLFLDPNYMVPDLAGGMPFNALAMGDFHIAYNLYHLFDPFTAFVVERFLVHGVAFLGMLLLLRDHLIPRGEAFNAFIVGIVAFSFAVIPHSMTRSGTVVYLPLLAWSALNMWRERPGIWNWIVIGIYPFFSALAWGGFMACGWLLAGTLLGIATHHPARHRLAWATLFLTLLSVVAEFRLFYHWFFPGYSYTSFRIAFRIEGIFDAPTRIQWSKVLSVFLNHFFIGLKTRHFSYHFPWVFVGLAMAAGTWIVSRQKIAARGKILGAVLALLVAISFLFAVFDSEQFLMKWFKLPLDLKRLDTISPTLWWIVFALSILSIRETARQLAWPHVDKILAGFLVVVALHTLLQFSGIKEAIKDDLGISQEMGFRAVFVKATLGNRTLLKGTEDSHVTLGKFLGTEVYQSENPLILYDRGTMRLRDYFMLDIFKQINPLIQARFPGGKQATKILTIGIPPSIALFHGYPILGGVFYDFPRAYYDEFEKIHAREKAKDHLDRRIESHVYAYVAKASRNLAEVSLDYDMSQFVRMGGRVVLSRFKLANPQTLLLEPAGQFGPVHLYFLKEGPDCQPCP